MCIILTRELPETIELVRDLDVAYLLVLRVRLASSKLKDQISPLYEIGPEVYRYAWPIIFTSELSWKYGQLLP